jgi:hypothetical protein
MACGRPLGSIPSTAKKKKNFFLLEMFTMREKTKKEEGIRSKRQDPTQKSEGRRELRTEFVPKT